MANQSDPGVSKFLARFVMFCSVLAVGFGLLVLAGWTFHIRAIKTFLPGQVAVKANTGLCFVLIGLALGLIRQEDQHRLWPWRAVVQTLALLVSVIGLLSFLEYWYGWRLGIDELLFAAGPEDIPGSVRPGLMSPVAALGFCLLGPAVALLDITSRWSHWLVQVLTSVVAVASIFGIMDFVLDPNATHTHISPTTALVLFLFSFGVMCSRTEWGLCALLVSAGSGGELARRLLPVAIGVPILIGWLRWKGEVTGIYSEWVGVAVMTVVAVILLGGLTTWTAFVIDRTEAERQRADELVRHLASIFTCSNDAIVGKTLDGIVTSWNPGAETTYGYSAQEIMGRPIAVTIPPDRLDEFKMLMQKVAQGEQVRQHETVRIRKDREMIHVSLSVSPLKDEAGKIVGASTIARDITDRKRAEEELRKASLYARSLLEASLDPLVTISREGKITDVNEATEKVTGVRRERLIGSDFSNYFTEPEKARRGYEEVFAAGFVHDYPLAIRHTSGRITDVLYNASIFKNETGEVEGVFAAARDITERKQAQDALQSSEKRYRSLVTATAQVVWITDPQGMVEDMPMWRAITGQSVDEVRGAGWLNAVHPADRDRTSMVWARAVKDRGLYEIEYRVRRNDGEYRHFAVRGVPVLEDDGRITEWVGTCSDVTERTRAEEEVRRLNDELEQRVIQRTAQLEAANKELEAFTYSVSHDLRAPLRHISGFSKILTEEFGSSLPADAQHHLQRIEEGTRRMGLLVDDLLNLARVGRRDLSLQVTGLKSVVEEVIGGLQPDVGDRHVQWQVGNLPYVECDTALMKQVFQNLLSNAVKFTRPRPQAVIEIGQEEQNGVPVIFVRDNGVGFSMKYADKLFGVFQRLHRVEDFEGTGVGLATVQRIIQKHGGRIWAEAELDKGATFYFTFGNSEKIELKTNAVVVGEKT